MEFMNPLHSKVFKLSLIAALLVNFNHIAGLESDKTAPIDYKATGDLKMHNEGNHKIVVIKDDVNVTQGTLSITGDEATIVTDRITNEVLNITVIGTPAHYQQQLEENGGTVIGYSDSILYSVGAETIVEFNGNANLQQPGTTTNCAAIKYFADNQLVSTTGPCSGVISSQPD